VARRDGQAGSTPPPEAVQPGALTALLEEIAHSPGAALGGAWDAALRPGAVVGRFELVREIGRGGFGVVWEAKDRDLGRSVAFKAVRAGGRTAVREERLLREAEAAARLSHPNLVTLFDLGRSEHGPYLVLELLQGRTLEERIAQGSLSVREAVRVGLEVAKGVAHAHTQGALGSFRRESCIACATTTENTNDVCPDQKLLVPPSSWRGRRRATATFETDIAAVESATASATTRRSRPTRRRPSLPRKASAIANSCTTPLIAMSPSRRASPHWSQTRSRRAVASSRDGTQARHRAGVRRAYSSATTPENESSVPVRTSA
jgi:hypothetical protein